MRVFHMLTDFFSLSFRKKDQVKRAHKPHRLWLGWLGTERLVAEPQRIRVHVHVRVAALWGIWEKEAWPVTCRARKPRVQRRARRESRNTIAARNGFLLLSFCFWNGENVHMKVRFMCSDLHRRTLFLAHLAVKSSLSGFSCMFSLIFFTRAD